MDNPNSADNMDFDASQLASVSLTIKIFLYFKQINLIL